MSDKSIMNIFKSNRTFPQRIKLTVSLKKNSHFWNQNAGCFTQKKKKKKLPELLEASSSNYFLMSLLTTFIRYQSYLVISRL